MAYRLTNLFCCSSLQALILAELGLAVHMNNDLLAFVAGVSLLILYLIFSASTEMGTKPWKKYKDEK